MEGLMSDLRAIAEKLVATELTSPTINYGRETSADVFTKFQWDSVKQVHDCLRFVALVQQLAIHPTAEIHHPKAKKRITAYHAKHVVEKWCGAYVPTHAFIAAARELDPCNLRLNDDDPQWSLPEWIYRLFASIKHSDDFRPLLSAVAEG